MVYGALGTMGLKVPLNFKQPFSATNLVDYWRGWHRTLSMVLKSLFYSPTKQAIGTNTAILVVFVSSALWHGVTINFLLWGFFHSVLYILTLFLLRKRAKLLPFSVMVIGVIIGRLLFSDSNTARLFEKLEFKYDGVHVFYELSHLPHSSLLALILGVTFITMEFVFRKHELFRSRNYKFYRIPAVQLVLLLLTLSFMTSEVGIDYAVYGQR
jgi:D-alanyl-lipoteichoic acid acyltransferase DltB (MBOAT superfamily)